MKIRPEQIETCIADTIEAWRAARQHCAAIADETVRPAAERVADALRDEALRDSLAPLFRAAVKGQKQKKAKKK